MPGSKLKKTLFRTGVIFNLLQLVLLKYASFTIDPIFQVFNTNFYVSKISEIVIVFTFLPSCKSVLIAFKTLLFFSDVNIPSCISDALKRKKLGLKMIYESKLCSADFIISLF